MVYETALQKIKRFMEANNIRPMKKWSQRSRKRRDGKILTNLFELRKQIRNLLIIFSGDDIEEMLKGNYFSIFG